MTARRASFWRRHPWLKWMSVSFVLIAAVLGVAAWVVARHTEPFLRSMIVEVLEDRFHARVELDSFHISVAHVLTAEGRGLRVWPPAQVAGVTAAPARDASDPLIRLAEFHFRMPLRYERGKPFHIAMIRLKGLDIHLPPKSHFGQGAAPSASTGSDAKKMDNLISFVVDTVECDAANLLLETSKPGKLPVDIEIAHLKLTREGGLNATAPVNFDADVTVPKPHGAAHATGTIGPWNQTDPGESALEGKYTFDNADLGSFKGIAGTLSSTGNYQGTLRELLVDGDTDTPNFALTHFGHTMALHTHFHAKVDATNGDTWLEPVNATLGHSQFTAQGQVVRVAETNPNTPGGLPAVKGHDIALHVDLSGARIEDFLYLASKSGNPLLTGALTMKAALHIPPGPAPVHERLNLKGAFNLDDVRFTSAKIQDKITELSLRGQGRPKDVKGADPGSIQSAMQGDFTMGGGVIALPELTYTVPGANIVMKGTYTLEGGGLDFAGKAKLNATVSQVVGGVWGVLLKPADRFFKKDGAGTELPIHVTGTREEPKFGVDFGHRTVSVDVPKKKTP
ncbi:MAG: AsmA-like C-terminal region-containing protein [Terracidiphilus sp.]